MVQSNYAEGHPPRVPAVGTMRRKVPQSWNVAKRAIDIIVSLIILLVFAPVLVVSMIAIVIASPGPPIFAQERVGRYGRRFIMYKLRTMRPASHKLHEELRSNSEVSGPVFKMKNDPRVFPVGRILRKTSIDELPNFVNVLLGSMSIVGPRPPLPLEVEGYGDYAFARLRTRPGITCLWQISGRSDVDFEQWMRLDNAYIDNWSPTYDLKIMFATIPAVLFGRGAY